MQLLEWTPNQVKQDGKSKPKRRWIKHEFVRADTLNCFWFARQIFDRNDGANLFLIVADAVKARALSRAVFIIKCHADFRTTSPCATRTATTGTVFVRRHDGGQSPFTVDQRFVHHNKPREPEPSAYKADDLHGREFFSQLHSMAKPGMRHLAAFGIQQFISACAKRRSRRQGR